MIIDLHRPLSSPARAALERSICDGNWLHLPSDTPEGIVSELYDVFSAISGHRRSFKAWIFFSIAEEARLEILEGDDRARKLARAEGESR